MANRKITKVLAGLQDILFGTGTVVQERNGQLVSITKIDAAQIPYEESGDTVRSKLGKKVEVVNNIAAMQAIATATFEDTYIYVLGYTSPGDGGGGLFYLDSASAAAEDLKVIFNPDDLANGRWTREDKDKQVSPNRGDANYTITAIDFGVQLFETPLTANRTVTAPAAVYEGRTHTIVRLDTANYTLDVLGVKTIPAQEAAAVTVVYTAGAWKLRSYAIITPAPIAGYIALLDAFPIGCIYHTTTAGNPSALFGGTWTQIARGRMLIGEGTSDATYAAGATGGESTHQLTEAELPAHTHTYNDLSQMTSPYNADPYSSHPSSNYNSAQNSGATGGDTPHNNMPPYLVVYIWERTA